MDNGVINLLLNILTNIYIRVTRTVVNKVEQMISQYDFPFSSVQVKDQTCSIYRTFY